MILLLPELPRERESVSRAYGPRISREKIFIPWVWSLGKDVVTSQFKCHNHSKTTALMARGSGYGHGSVDERSKGLLINKEGA